MSNLRVLIVGASVAGPTAAYWFAKAGANVTIIERFPKLRTNGQNIDIRTAGVTVMRKMPGMEDAVRAKVSPIEGFSLVHEDGRPFATMKPSGDANQQSLVSEFEIARGDLGQVLFDLTKDHENVKYVFGEQVASMKQGEDFVTVDFANGYPTSEYDLVVACDGSTSRTRALGLECDVRDYVSPMNCWASYFSIDKDLIGGSKMGQSWNTIGGRWLAIGPESPSSSHKNLVTIMNINPRDSSDATLPFREAAKKGDYALKQYIAETFQGLGWKTKEILEGMMATATFYAAEVVQVKVPSLYKGRFVLVGDAGYAPGFTGTGTSLALTGAYVLAGEIASHRQDIAAGLKAYEERMKPIIKDMQKIPPGLPGLMAPQTVWRIRLRNVLFRVVFWAMGFSKYFSWIGSSFASSFGKDKYNLPDYEWRDESKKDI